MMVKYVYQSTSSAINMKKDAIALYCFVVGCSKHEDFVSLQKFRNL